MRDLKKRFQIITYLSISIVSLALLGCKPSLSDGELKLVVGPTTASVLPVPLNTCKSGGAGTPSIASPSYEFTKFKYTWQGTKDYSMSYIQVVLRSGFLQGGVDSSCILNAADLDATLGAFAPRNVSAGDAVEKVAGCSIRCGSLKIDPNVSNAYISGVVRVVGIQTDADGNSTPVVSEAPIAVQYTKIQ